MQRNRVNGSSSGTCLPLILCRSITEAPANQNAHNKQETVLGFTGLVHVFLQLIIKTNYKEYLIFCLLLNRLATIICIA